MKKVIKTIGLLCMLAFMAAGLLPEKVYATGEANPRIIVDKYSLPEGEIIPGEEFELTLTLRNTSIFYDTYSVVVTVSDDTGTIYPVYGASDQKYIERVYARNTSEITIPLKAEEDILEGTVPLKVTITYNDNYFIEKQTNTTMVFLPVRLSGDLNVVSCSLPESVSVGTKARISVTYENTGSKNLYNIIMTVSGEEPDDELVTNLYSLGGGDKNTAEVYLDCNQIGSQPVKVSFTYEDEEGEAYETEEAVYSIAVTDSADSEMTEDAVTIIGGGINFITYILLAAIVVIAIFILMIIRHGRR